MQIINPIQSHTKSLGKSIQHKQHKQLQHSGQESTTKIGNISPPPTVDYIDPGIILTFSSLQISKQKCFKYNTASVKDKIKDLTFYQEKSYIRASVHTADLKNQDIPRFNISLPKAITLQKLADLLRKDQCSIYISRCEDNSYKLNLAATIVGGMDSDSSSPELVDVFVSLSEDESLSDSSSNSTRSSYSSSDISSYSSSSSSSSEPSDPFLYNSGLPLSAQNDAKIIEIMQDPNGIETFRECMENRYINDRSVVNSSLLINDRFVGNRTLLMLAAEYGNLKIVTEILSDRWIADHQKASYVNQTGPLNRTALHFVCMSDGIENIDNRKNIITILAQHRSNSKPDLGLDEHPIHKAARYNAELVKKLLEHKDELKFEVNISTFEGRTPYIIAAMDILDDMKRKSIQDVLSQHGADKNKSDIYGKNAEYYQLNNKAWLSDKFIRVDSLIRIIKTSDWEALKKIIDEDKNILRSPVNQWEDRIFNTCTFFQKPELLKKLKEYLIKEKMVRHTHLDQDIARFFSQPNAKGQTPIYWAVWNNNEEIVRFFLEDIKVNPNVADQIIGETPLHRAVLKGHLSIVKMLLEIDSSQAIRPNLNGQTALHICAFSKASPEEKNKIMNELILHIVSENRFDEIHRPDNNGKCACDYVFENCSTGLLKQFVEFGVTEPEKISINLIVPILRMILHLPISEQDRPNYSSLFDNLTDRMKKDSDLANEMTRLLEYNKRIILDVTCRLYFVLCERHETAYLAQCVGNLLTAMTYNNDEDKKDKEQYLKIKFLRRFHDEYKKAEAIRNKILISRLKTNFKYLRYETPGKVWLPRFATKYGGHVLGVLSLLIVGGKWLYDALKK